MKNTHKYLYLVFLAATGLFLSACSAKQQPSTSTVFHAKADGKLKQKAVLLHKKMEAAQRTLTEDQRAIDRLREQLCDAELNAIESKIESLENQWRSHPQRLIGQHRDISYLFLDERETLNRIIRMGPDSLRAQSLLDRVLQLITQVSDSAPLTGSL
jgi:hypothetical protein